MTSRIAVFFALLTGFISLADAGAVVLPNTSSFVAQECGAQTIDVGRMNTHVMESACVGVVPGTTFRAVRFTLSNDQTFVFRIVSQSNLTIALSSGATKAIFQLVGENGEQVAMRAIIDHGGAIRSVSGVFQTNSYIVPAFDRIMTLQ